jgi:hypothetical protein
MVSVGILKERGVQALRQFADCDSEKIQNRPGYLMGVLRRLSEKSATGGPGRRSPRSGSGTGISRQRSGNGGDFDRGRGWGERDRDRDRDRERDRSRR